MTIVEFVLPTANAPVKPLLSPEGAWLGAPTIGILLVLKPACRLLYICAFVERVLLALLDAIILLPASVLL